MAASAGATRSEPRQQASWAASATPRPHQPYRRAPSASPRPKSCEAKLETMKTMPIGRMSTLRVLSAPVVVAASAGSPRCETITAAATPTTTWVDRETTMGQASARRRPRVGVAGRGRACGDDTHASYRFTAARSRGRGGGQRSGAQVGRERAPLLGRERDLGRDGGQVAADRDGRGAAHGELEVLHGGEPV